MCTPFFMVKLQSFDMRLCRIHYKIKFAYNSYSHNTLTLQVIQMVTSIRRYQSLPLFKSSFLYSAQAGRKLMWHVCNSPLLYDYILQKKFGKCFGTCVCIHDIVIFSLTWHFTTNNILFAVTLGFTLNFLTKFSLKSLYPKMLCLIAPLDLLSTDNVSSTMYLCKLLCDIAASDERSLRPLFYTGR